MKKRKYVIVTPRQTGGGPIVLHALCKYLGDLGENAKVFYINDYMYLDDRHVKYWIKWILFFFVDLMKISYVKFIGENNIKNKAKFNGYINVPLNCKRKYLPFISKDTIVIYPEIVFGNILHSPNVVRWFLFHGNRYDKIRDTLKGNQYGDSDLFYCFRDIFNVEKYNPNYNKLYIQYYNLDTYKRHNFGPRNGICYVIRKGKNRNDLPKNFDGIIIDNLSEKEKVEVLNNSKYCISYDTQTAYSQIAALCGCISIVVPEPGKSKADYRTENDIDYGEAFGFDEKEIQRAQESAHKVLEYYKKVNNEGKEAVKEFVEKCEAYFLVER